MRTLYLLLTVCAACAGRDLDVAAAPLPSVIQEVDEQALGELERAWLLARAGTGAVEEAVLLVRLPDGGWEARLEPHSNVHAGARFSLPPGAAAIFHTHPNAVLAEPSRQDRRLADRLGLPVFTLASEGLFVYDPRAGRVLKLMDRLQWLDAERWRRLAGR